MQTWQVEMREDDSAAAHIKFSFYALQIFVKLQHVHVQKICHDARQRHSFLCPLDKHALVIFNLLPELCYLSHSAKLEDTGSSPCWRT